MFIDEEPFATEPSLEEEDDDDIDSDEDEV